MRILLSCIALTGLAVSCTNSSQVKSSSDQNDSARQKKDVLAVNMDTSVDPSRDFFLYANGGWIKNNPIPGDRGSWGIGNLVQEENWKRLREISEKADSSDAAKGTSEQKIGDFWSTAMDSARIEKQG